MGRDTRRRSMVKPRYSLLVAGRSASLTSTHAAAGGAGPPAHGGRAPRAPPLVLPHPAPPRGDVGADRPHHARPCVRPDSTRVRAARWRGPPRGRRADERRAMALSLDPDPSPLSPPPRLALDFRDSRARIGEGRSTRGATSAVGR